MHTKKSFCFACTHTWDHVPAAHIFVLRARMFTYISDARTHVFPEREGICGGMQAQISTYAAVISSNVRSERALGATPATLKTSTTRTRTPCVEKQHVYLCVCVCIYTCI